MYILTHIYMHNHAYAHPYTRQLTNLIATFGSWQSNFYAIALIEGPFTQRYANVHNKYQVAVEQCAAGINGGAMYLGGDSTADISGFSRFQYVSGA
jgi:hypothetical protein